MIKSMTGFGRAEARGRQGLISVEVRTVNHRYLDILLRLPQNLSTYEDRLRQTIKKYVNRGTVNLSVTFEPLGRRKEIIELDMELARKYAAALSRLKKAVRTEGNITFAQISTFPGVVQYRVEEASAEGAAPLLDRALQKALCELVRMRAKEGAFLCRDLLKRVTMIERCFGSIKKRSSIAVDQYKQRLSKRVKQISGLPQLDMQRVELEVALYAKNSDITEEITRILSHLANFKSSVIADGAVGRKLDFITQELQREVNTMGQKSLDVIISRNVVTIKTEIEKIREQVQNVE